MDAKMTRAAFASWFGDEWLGNEGTGTEKNWSQKYESNFWRQPAGGGWRMADECAVSLFFVVFVEG